MKHALAVDPMTGLVWVDPNDKPSDVVAGHNKILLYKGSYILPLRLVMRLKIYHIGLLSGCVMYIYIYMCVWCVCVCVCVYLLYKEGPRTERLLAA